MQRENSVYSSGMEVDERDGFGAQKRGPSHRRSISHIPKAPVETRLFRDDSLDRLYSNIPYPPSSGPLRPELAKLYDRKTQSFGGYSHRGSLSETHISEQYLPGPPTCVSETSVLVNDSAVNLKKKAPKDDAKETNVALQLTLLPGSYTDDDKCSYHWSELDSNTCWKDAESRSSCSVASTFVVHNTEADKEWDRQSSFTAESYEDSVLSFDSLDAFDELEEELEEGPKLKPLKPSFLKDCMTALNSSHLHNSRHKRVSGSPNFCPKSFHLLAEESGIVPKAARRQGSLLQVASAVEAAMPKPYTKSFVQKPHHESPDHYPSKFDFHKDFDSVLGSSLMHKFDPSQIDWDLDLLEGSSSEESIRGKATNVKKGHKSGVGGWFHSALGLSFKLLVMISGVAMLVHNAKRGKAIENLTKSDFSIFDFTSISTKPFFNSGAFPVSILDSSSPHKPH